MPVEALFRDHSLDLQSEGVTRLLAHPEWPRTDFDAAATAVGLMPDGAMEAINEWAFDKYGDALLEDGDLVAINLELLSDDLEAITAAK